MRGRPVLNPVKPSHGAVHHVDNRPHTAVRHPPMPIAWANRFQSFSGAESHQSVRLRTAGARTSPLLREPNRPCSLRGGSGRRAHGCLRAILLPAGRTRVRLRRK